MILHAGMTLGGMRNPAAARLQFTPFLRQGIPWESSAIVSVTGGRQIDGFPPDYTGSTEQMRDIACKLAGREK